MALSESRKLANRAWDKENMHTFSCRMRKHDAVLFLEYCDEHGTTPAAEIKKFINKTISAYCDEKEKHT